MKNSHERFTALFLGKNEIILSEPLVLFRGENPANIGGLHFTLDQEWAAMFGSIILSGELPVCSRIKRLTDKDLENGFRQGFTSERPLWDFLFAQGFDAIFGRDAMNSEKADFIVHPNHRNLFTVIKKN